MNAKLERSVKVGHLAFAVITMLVSMGAAYGATMYRLAEVERKADLVHEMREDIREVKTDLQWVKQRLR